MAVTAPFDPSIFASPTISRYAGASRYGPYPKRPDSLREAFELRLRRGEGCWTLDGAVSGGGYSYIDFRGCSYRAHRVSYELYVGPIPAHMVIDHMCRNRACVNPDHLHPVTPKENSENTGPSASNSSGARGVSWDRRTSRWYARVGHHGKVYWLGRFHSFQDAAAAARDKRNELYTNNRPDWVA